jgi:hypothetical protein
LQDFVNHHAQQVKLVELTNREEALKQREDAVGQAETALAEREKTLQKWAEQLQNLQNELLLQQQQQQPLNSQNASRQTAVGQVAQPSQVQTRRQSVDRRMSVEPMACDEGDDTENTVQQTQADNIPPPPPPISAPLSQPPTNNTQQSIYTFGSACPTQKAFGAPTTGFVIFNDKTNDLNTAAKQGKDALNGKLGSYGMRVAPGIPSYARVNSAPAAPNAINANKPSAQRFLTGAEDAQENQHHYDRAHARRQHNKYASQDSDGINYPNSNALNAKYVNVLISEGSISPWKKQRQFAGPVPVPVTSNNVTAAKAPTTHYVNIQALLAGQPDIKGR